MTYTQDLCTLIRCLEVLGMRNMSSNFTGMGLCPLFQDPRRAVNIRYVSFSGTKTVSHVYYYCIVLYVTDFSIQFVTGNALSLNTCC